VKDCFTPVKRVKATKKTEPPPVEIALSPGAAIDDILGVLGKVQNAAAWTRSDLYDAEREIRSVQSDFRQADWPIRNVEFDDDKKDVHMEGYAIDNAFRSAKYDLQDSSRSIDNADRKTEDMDSALAYSFKKIDELEKELGSKPDENKTVLEHLAAAKKHVSGARTSTGRMDGKIDDGDRKIDDVDRDMIWSDSYISRIKFDSVGKDVSFEGRQLRSIVSRAEWNLRDAENDTTFARMDLGSLESSVVGALDALKKAKAALG
jgi:chromosome segregation ATPase